MDLGEKLPKIGSEFLKRVEIEKEGSTVMATEEHMRDQTAGDIQLSP
jgi:hypothetical protein